jgi:hypothetical protein
MTSQCSNWPQAGWSRDQILVGGKIFHTHPDWPWGPPSLLYDVYWVFFLGVKWPGHGIDHPPSTSARAKGRVQLYLYSPSGPSRPVLEWTLPFTFYTTLPMDTNTNVFVFTDHWCLYDKVSGLFGSPNPVFPYKALPLPIAVLSFKRGFQDCNLCKYYRFCCTVFLIMNLLKSYTRTGLQKIVLLFPGDFR